MEITIKQALELGIKAHKAGRIDEADRYYTAILKENPQHPDANHNLGLLAIAIGKPEIAVPLLKKALEAKPNIIQFWKSYIDILISIGETNSATEILRQAIQYGINKSDLEQYVRLLRSEEETSNDHNTLLTSEKEKSGSDDVDLIQGLALVKKKEKEGNLIAAKAICSRLKKKFPNNSQVQKISKRLREYSGSQSNVEHSPSPKVIQAIVNDFGNGRLQNALRTTLNLISEFPKSIVLHNLLGAIYAEQKQLEKALKAHIETTNIDPNFAEGYFNAGIVLKELGKLKSAEEAYKKAILIKPKYAEAWNSLGLTLREQLKLDDAVVAFKKALKFKTNYLTAHINLGITQKDLGNLELAQQSYNNAIKISSDSAEAHYNKGFALLNENKLKEGLILHEWRWKTPERLGTERNFSQPVWDGRESLQGKTILLWSEQGIGDTVNWSSGISHIEAQGARCLLECQGKLVSLLSRSFPNIEVKPEDRRFDASRNDFDYQLPMGSLYKHFVSQIAEREAQQQFLIPDKDRVRYWKERLDSIGEGPHIGIGWKSSNMSASRLQNYAPIEEWLPVLEIPNVTFINLQYGDVSADLDILKSKFDMTIHRFDDLDLFDNIDDAAALSAALDLVVSTISAVPIISAGVGTHTILAAWKQSPWSNKLFNPVGPAVNIFTRNSWDSWRPTFERIASDIKVGLSKKILNDELGE